MNARRQRVSHLGLQICQRKQGIVVVYGCSLQRIVDIRRIWTDNDLLRDLVGLSGFFFYSLVALNRGRYRPHS